MNQIRSEANAREIETICSNILGQFDGVERPAEKHLDDLLQDLQSKNAQLSYSIGVETQDKNAHILRGLDDKFDTEFRCFKAFVDAYLLCGIPEIVESTLIVQRKLDLHDPMLYKFGYENEISAFKSLKNDLSAPETKVHLDKLPGASESFSRLVSKWEAVQQMYVTCEIEKAKRENIPSSSVQKTAIRKLLNEKLLLIIEVQSWSNPTVFGTIAQNISQFIDTINLKIRQRFASSHSDEPTDTKEDQSTEIEENDTESIQNKSESEDNNTDV